MTHLEGLLLRVRGVLPVNVVLGKVFCIFSDSQQFITDLKLA